MSSLPQEIVNTAAERATRYRWLICALLFTATAINYIDRQMIGVLKPVLQTEFGWTETQYGDIVFWFQAAYALGFLAVGRFMDRVGARVGYAIAFTFWNLAHIAHGFASGVVQFAMTRFALGIGEAGNFPAGLKAVAEWFPQRERAFAVGLFNAGANVGAIVTPLLVPAIVLAYGWRAAFIATGVVSLIWVIAWLAIYRRPEDHPRVSAAELALIRSDPVKPTGQLLARSPNAASAWTRRSRCRGEGCSPSGRRGPMRFRSSARTPSGGCFCSGCLIF